MARKKQPATPDPSEEAEREIRDVLNRHFGRMPENAYLEQSLEVLAVISEGLEMRQRELESEEEDG